MKDIGEEDFVAYVGDPGIHDGQIVSFKTDGDSARCLVKTSNDRLLNVEFHGVASIESRTARSA